MEGGPAGCKAGKSHYVQRLDQIDSFYCIVPFENRKEITTAAVIINGRFGDYLQSTAFIQDGSDIFFKGNPTSKFDVNICKIL